MYFKSFMKIFRTQLPSLMLYLGIFLGIAILNMQIGGSDKTAGYVNESISVAVVDRDNSSLSKGLTKCLDENTDIVEIMKDDQGMEDALFERVAEYIIIIPKGYEDAMAKGEILELESKKVPDAYSAVFAENIINQYISTFRTYLTEYEKSTSVSEIVSMTNESMKTSVNVSIDGKKSEDDSFVTTCFDFGVYIILACVIIGVSEILAIFFNKNIADRMDISPISNVKKNLILVLYSLFYMMIVWIINVIMYIGMFKGEILDKINLLRFINMLCLSMVAAAIGFVISILVKSKGGRGAVINTIALGFSFISGAFVPMDFLGKGVVKLASFLPAYWYIKGNEHITEMVIDGSTKNISKLLNCMGVQMLFFLALISIGMVIRKRYTRQMT